MNVGLEAYFSLISYYKPVEVERKGWRIEGVSGGEGRRGRLWDGISDCRPREASFTLISYYKPVEEEKKCGGSRGYQKLRGEEAGCGVNWMA